MSKRFIPFFIVFIIIQQLVAQSNDKIIPPSPTAYSFSTYGSIPIDRSSGAFSYSIPIFTIKEKDITLPIRLDYNSCGVKTDELSGIVATDWILSTGGVLSRIMRGYPDEKADRWYPESLDIYNEDIKNKIIAIASGALTDVERDWFSFNVNGISGSFYFDEYLNIVVNSKEYVKITKENKGYDPIYGDILNFTITDNKGYKYIFGGSNAFLEGTKPTTFTNSSVITQTSGSFNNYYSAWFLRRIISPNQNSIDFIYKDNDFSYNQGVSYYLTYSGECVSHPSLESHTRDFSSCIQHIQTTSKVLSEIVFSTGKVLFNYSNNRADKGGLLLKSITKKDTKENNIKKVLLNYETQRYYSNLFNERLSLDNSLNYRIFLNGITFYDNASADSLKYSFEYKGKESLPSRLSISKDKYGYCNGSSNYSPFSKTLKNDESVANLLKRYNESLVTANLEVNPSLVHSGILSKIYYPAGGQTKIIYEANSTEITEYKETFENQAHVLMKDFSEYSTDTKIFNFTATSNGQIKYYATGYLYTVPGSPPPTSDPAHDLFSLSIYDLTDKKFLLNIKLPYGSSISSEDYGLSKIFSVTGHIYEVTFKLLSRFNTATGSVNMSYNPQLEAYSVPLYGGGARVQSIEDIDKLGKVYNKRKYYYNSLSAYPSNASSLGWLQSPKYYYRTSFQKDCSKSSSTSGEPIQDLAKTTFFSPVRYLYNYRRPVSSYTHITEFFENNDQNNGAIERSFYDNYDSPPLIVWGEPALDIPNSNQGEGFSGLLKKENYFQYNSGKYTLIEEKKWNYSSSAQYIRSNVFSANYKFISGPIINGVAPNFKGVSIASYYNYMNAVKLDSCSVQTYFSTGKLSSNAFYDYGGKPYYNTLKETISLSTGENLINKYQYAPDLLGKKSNMERLVDSNRVSIPIITQTYKGKSTPILVSQITNTYKYISKKKNDNSLVDLIVPEFTYKTNIMNSSEEKRISFDNYDVFGNNTEYAEDDINTVYLWSYSGQYPIAEIKGVSYSDVEIAAKSTFDVTSIDVLSEQLIPNEAKLRDGSLQKALQKALVTTYTYKPLVGILTATDPSGITTYYDYDSFGRLKETYIYKDNIVSPTNKQVVQKYEYHFQNQ